MAEVGPSAPRRAITQAIDVLIHITRTPEGRRVEDILSLSQDLTGAYGLTSPSDGI